MAWRAIVDAYSVSFQIFELFILISKLEFGELKGTWTLQAEHFRIYRHQCLMITLSSSTN